MIIRRNATVDSRALEIGTTVSGLHPTMHLILDGSNIYLSASSLIINKFGTLKLTLEPNMINGGLPIISLTTSLELSGTLNISLVNGVSKDMPDNAEYLLFTSLGTMYVLTHFLPQDVDG
jgi:hypothetical protein